MYFKRMDFVNDTKVYSFSARVPHLSHLKFFMLQRRLQSILNLHSYKESFFSHSCLSESISVEFKAYQCTVYRGWR